MNEQSSSDDSGSRSTPPEALVIRRAEQADQAQVDRLIESGVLTSDPAGVTPLRADEHLHDESFILWVAEKPDSGRVGMIGLRKLDLHTAELRRLRVHQDHRGEGIGRRLVAHALDYCKRESILKVILDTRVEQSAAIELFKQFGFQLSRERETNGKRLLDFYLDLYRDEAS